MRVGIIELVAATPWKGWANRLYATYLGKQFVGIMPQAVAVWCRQRGHHVIYATYYGQKDSRHLLPDQLEKILAAVEPVVPGRPGARKAFNLSAVCYRLAALGIGVGFAYLVYSQWDASAYSHLLRIYLRLAASLD